MQPSARIQEEEEGQPRQKLAALSGAAGAKLGTLSLSSLEAAAAQQNLQVLDLKDNKISAVPAEIYRAFTQVKVLDIRKNALEELLPEISAMRMLEELLADQNRLKELPPEVCRLPCLKALSLSQNLLKGLPEAIGEMQQLRHLSLGDNHVEEIPTEIGLCKELQILYLHHNHFAKLPTSLGKLENLAELALEWFRYTTPPLPRVIKGAEWKRIITKLVGICKEKQEQGEQFITCIEVLSQFSQKAFDPNAIDSKRRTRLHVACLEGHAGVATALAESGSKCDSLDCEGYSPLLVAVREEHPDIASALVKVGVDVNRGGGLFGSPLHVATVNFDPHMVMLLIHGRADVNQTDADGNTPLHVLMSVFDKGGKRAGAIGQILLKHHADCNAMNSDKWAPLHLAARRGQLRGICFVLSHTDSVDGACLKGSCACPPAQKKPKSGRVRTCTRVFDVNLRGGSHLWTPLHLAGHACHVPVVQVLIEAGADVFLRNIDGRTPRHVSRGNLAISKLLRKAEDEWLWYRIHRDPADDEALQAAATAGEPAPSATANAAEPAPSAEPGSASPRKAAAPAAAASDTPAAAKPAEPSPRQNDDALLESLKVEDDEDDMIEEIAKNIEGTHSANSGGAAAGGTGIGERPPQPGGPPAPERRPGGGVRQKTNRIMDKCRDTHFSKAELQQMQAANFSVPTTSAEDFMASLTRLTQQGPKHRLPFLLSKPWVKELVPKILEDERTHSVLLQPSLVTNEDFIRMLICNLPREQLPSLGKFRNKEQETLLHVLCKCGTPRAAAATASGADILSLLLTVCPPETLDLEARDLRGQTALHLATQSGDIGLVQVLLEHGANPNAQEETTGWTPLHFTVAKAHYPLILQLLHHDSTNVNQVDKFDWPPLLEACSRLDARSTSLLVNGGANLAFRNQHQFDVLKAVDTSKKDLAAKRWMSCLVVSNGFRFQDSAVQLSQEDRETLERERSSFETRAAPLSSRAAPAPSPPFYVPDHLAPRCHSCKVLFSVTVRRCRCRCCGLVLCGDCSKWRATDIVALDERLRTQQFIVRDDAALPAALGGSRLSAAAETPTQERGSASTSGRAPQRERAPAAVAGSSAGEAPSDAGARTETAVVSASALPEEPLLAEELPAVSPPTSVACFASMAAECAGQRAPGSGVRPRRSPRSIQGALSRERGQSAASAGTPPRLVRLCSPCATFYEAGVGETCSVLSQRGY